MTLATMDELCDMTGRTKKALTCWFCEHGFHRVCFERGTKLALYDVEAYNNLVDKVNKARLMARADVIRVANHIPLVKREKRVKQPNETTEEKILFLRAKRLPAMAIAKRLGLDLVFVNEFLARKEAI